MPCIRLHNTEGIAETNLDIMSSTVQETALDDMLGADGSGVTRKESEDEAPPPPVADYDYEDPTFSNFALMFFSEIHTHEHQRTPIVVPLLKQVWGDGDAHRALVCWYSACFWT
jgi:hypothetical protein